MRRVVELGFAIFSLGAVPASAQNVYFGNLHAHTIYSDGSGTPDDAYRSAREAGLDFIAISEHNHAQAEGAGDEQRIHIARDPTLYSGTQASSLISAAGRHTVDGQFVALYGQEFSTISKGNHVNVFDVPAVIDAPNNQFHKLIAWTGQHLDSSGRPAILQFNHPALADDEAREYGRDDFASPAIWLRTLDAQAELIEMFNGPAMAKTSGNRSAEVQERDYYHYLNLGFHLAPSVGHDNHYPTWGSVTDARVAVLAGELTKTAVLDALRARHVYATSDKNLRLILRSGSSLQGDIVAAGPALESELPLTLMLTDGDEPGAGYRIDVFSDSIGNDPIDPRRPANSFERTGDTPAALALDGIPYTGPGQYIVVR